jgi:hypothetical protein
MDSLKETSVKPKIIRNIGRGEGHGICWVDNYVTK